MKRFFITILFLLMSFVLLGEDSEIYRHFGTANFIKGINTKVSIEAYITKTLVDDSNRKSLISYKYLYEIVLISHSVHNGSVTDSWLEGTRIILNGMETSAKTYPNGFTVLVKQTPTVIYWLEMDSENPNISLRWNEAKYEPVK